MDYCSICGEGFESTTNKENICSECKTDMLNMKVCSTGVKGWICPKCEASLSPYTGYCPFCAPVPNFTCGFNRLQTGVAKFLLSKGDT